VCSKADEMASLI